MLYPTIFLLELLMLFFVSRLLTKKLSALIYRLTKSQQATIFSMAFLFFPGTIIHELSHALMAGLLFVPTGHIELWPKLEGDHVKLGSVAIAETDILRRFIIGAAPFLLGTSLLLGLLFFAAQHTLFTNNLYIILLAYTAFEIGNTMFSSKKDMEGALELLITLAVIGTILYFLGIRIPNVVLENFFNSKLVLQVFQQGSLYLTLPLGLDILILFILKILSFRKL